MAFEQYIGELRCKHMVVAFRRNAIRAIILNDDKLLMIHTNNGDFKFPGGCTENEETHEETIARQVTDKTGLEFSGMKALFAKIIECRPDKRKTTLAFELTTFYYFCEIENPNSYFRNIDSSEINLEYKPIWINIIEAIRENEYIMHRKPEASNGVKRELTVLYELLRIKNISK